MKLALPCEFWTRIELEARAAYPGECCGLIEGVRDGDSARVLALHPARNIAAARDRFEIHPEDHFAALKAARVRDHAIIGCYHSHPGGEPRPSETDRAGAGEENFLWLIAALSHAAAPIRLGAFAYRAAAFEPVTLGGADGADLVTSSEKLVS
jgi:proteasome lid subunit RPN8/RPN11